MQGLLSRLNDPDRVSFDELLKAELSAMGSDEGRVTLQGPPDIRLRSSTVQTLAMALHELATNAVKYGALCEDGGRLTVSWQFEAEGEGHKPWLQVDWRETGVTMPLSGPTPPGSGQGRELIEQALPYQLSARTTYHLGPDGVHCTISLPVLILLLIECPRFAESGPKFLCCDVRMWLTPAQPNDQQSWVMCPLSAFLIRWTAERWTTYLRRGLHWCCDARRDGSLPKAAHDHQPGDHRFEGASEADNRRRGGRRGLIRRDQSHLFNTDQRSLIGGEQGKPSLGDVNLHSAHRLDRACAVGPRHGR